MPESFGRWIKTRSKHDKAEGKKHKEIVQMVIQEVEWLWFQPKKRTKPTTTQIGYNIVLL